MVAVPSFVSEEREGWVWMLMEVDRAWRREKEGGKEGFEGKSEWTCTCACWSRIQQTLKKGSGIWMLGGQEGKACYIP
jgi:hypothetical protein